MNLFEALKLLPASALNDAPIPASLFGAFRRKSITFFNGLTDEKTIVYWFQSKTFTIDLRLKSQDQTPLAERQGWIGQTIWDDATEQLSWEISDHANFQNHVQWPEPAKLHTVGNCILEFSPSNAYVEDWRQQADQGLYLGLRIQNVIHINTQQDIALDGGLIICGHHMVYAQSRFPDFQAQLKSFPNIFNAIEQGIQATVIESFEVSVSTKNQIIEYSTQSSKIHQSIYLDDFEIIDDQTLRQRKTIQDEVYDIIFKVDIYHPNYHFQRITPLKQSSQNWFDAEKEHLSFHAITTN